MTSKADDIKELISQLKLWEKGVLNDYNASLVIARTNRKLTNACYCDDNVCCGKHSTHSMPHKNCILR